MIEALQNIEALKNAAAVKIRPAKMPSDDPIPQRPSEQQLGEAASLSAAIQRLITERDHHRGRVGAQEHELTRLRTVNEELRRQNERMALARDHYLQLATEVLTTLKHIDGTIHEVVQKTLGAARENEESDAALLSLARRLAPSAVTNGQAANPR
ncbi:MAG: hypothetical protein ACXWJN_01020 [Methyloceanibacter sp.]